MEAVRGHSPGDRHVVGLWCIPRCGQKGGELTCSSLTYASVGNGFPPLAKRLVEQIQVLECVEQAIGMQGVLDPEPHPQHHVILPGLEVARAKRKAVEDVWTWTMCFTMCIAVVGKKHPDMMPEMLAYILPILWAHQEWEEPTWHGYNVPFRQQVAISRNMA